MLLWHGSRFILTVPINLAVRKSGDARVIRVPTDEEIKRVEKRYPGTVIHPQVKEGMKLSDLLEQDSYSYAICHLFIGGRDRKELLDN